MKASLAGAALLAFALPASAQMQLPGALNGAAPAESGGAPHPKSGGSSAVDTSVPAKPVIIAAPGSDKLAGRTLHLDGNKGILAFADDPAAAKAGGSGRTAPSLQITKLQFAGEKISKPGTSCTVDIPIPVETSAVGRPEGAFRFAAAVPSCPFSFDLLDGAVLVSRAPTDGKSGAPACEFKTADCKVSPAGLWGPSDADLTPKQDKDLERERVRLETTMRANFRALIKRAKSDKTAVKSIARDQAAFSSDREMTCRDYQNESVHGFCSTQITEARVLALIAKFGPDAEDGEHKHARTRVHPRPKMGEPAAADSPKGPASSGSNAAPGGGAPE